MCAQGLLLRAHGYRCDHGVLYFAAARRRVRVEFDEALVRRTRELRELASRVVGAACPPAPLVDSPKCLGCSLAGICLPDEQNLLAGVGNEVRPIAPPRGDGLPLYVRLQGGSLGKDHEELVVREKGAVVGRARLGDTSRVVVLGNATMSTAVLAALAEADVPVSLHSGGGWYRGSFLSASGHNVAARIAQHAVAADEARRMEVARRMIAAKVHNQRVLLRRNGRGVAAEVLVRLRELATDTARAETADELMGMEGAAAALYFGSFPTMLREDRSPGFAFEQRNRRPPRDPVNALLSFAYACLVRESTLALHAVGLDPYVGVLHRPRAGRPALALDHPTGVALQDAGRRRFIEVIERRLDEIVTHPVFDTRLSYRRILEIQARLLSRVFTGEVAEYPGFKVR